jgi:hypothetical protein
MTSLSFATETMSLQSAIDDMLSCIDEALSLIRSACVSRPMPAADTVAPPVAVKSRARRTSARTMGFSRVTYRKTACGWLEPSIHHPSDASIPRVKDMPEYQARLLRDGCTPCGTDGEWTLLRTPQDSIIRVHAFT